MVTRFEGGKWTEPVVAPFCESGRIELEPHFAPDGQRLYFLSDRPDRAAGEEEGGDQDIWFVEREGDGWGEAHNLGAPINSDEPEFYPSLTRDGTLYFTRGGRESFIYRARLVDGVYEEPVRLPEQVNAGATQFNAFVDPDEEWILVPIAGMEESLGGVDYFVSFRNEDDTWTGPIHLAHGINSEANREWSASLTPDGRYLFFMSARTIDLEESPRTQREMIALAARPGNGASDIYWIDASVIESYRPR
jgi:hypothetical protein